MLRLSDNHDQPLTLTDGERSFTFADWACLRIGKDKIEVSGDLRAMKLPAKGRPKLLINGKSQKASFAGGYLSYNQPSR